MSDLNKEQQKSAPQEMPQEEILKEEVLQEDIPTENPELEIAEEEIVEEEIAQGASEKTAEKTEEKKKSIFTKKKDKKDEQIEELNDRWKRTLAEFDNFRKRSEKEKELRFDMGARHVVEKLLPIVDNFERGLGALGEEEKDSPFANGMDMVYKQLMKMFEEMEVEPIDAVGKPFDPELHNAVMHLESEDYGENVVVQVFQKGYTYKGTVVRHAMVQVAN